MKRLRNLPLTRRGWTVTAVVVGAVVLALLFGARSLNAVVAPAALAIVVAIWRVSRLDFPTLTRGAPSVGTDGERHEIAINLESSVEQIGWVHDEVSDGLTVVGNEKTVPLEQGITYDLELTGRGRYILGPTRVAVRDILGLAEVTKTYPNRKELLVYPKIHPVTMPALERLAEAANITLSRERHEFDRLREYQPTDALRDIHWKSSAKRPQEDFIVKEFVSVQERGSVVISGAAADDGDDALAEAMASLASALVDAGIEVGVLTAAGKVDPIRNRGQFDRILTNLAVMDAGHPQTQAEIHLSAAEDDVESVEITVNEYEFTFGEFLLGEDIDALEPSQEVPVASIGEVAD